MQYEDETQHRVRDQGADEPRLDELRQGGNQVSARHEKEDAGIQHTHDHQGVPRLVVCEVNHLAAFADHFHQNAEPLEAVGPPPQFPAEPDLTLVCLASLLITLVA